MSAPDRVLVAGGGIGGLAAARALSLTGRSSIVVEQAPEFQEIGAGIQIGPNGFRMLETLGLRNAIDDLAVFPDDLIVMDGVSAEEVTRIPVGRDFRERFGNPYALVHRADLHRVLLDACRTDPAIELRSGATLDSFHDEGDHICAVTTAGHEIEATALVGADGLWSATRQAMPSSAARVGLWVRPYS